MFTECRDHPALVSAQKECVKVAALVCLEPARQELQPLALRHLAWGRKTIALLHWGSLQDQLASDVTMCCRCKRPMPSECPGLPDCNFDSNCFIGKKSNMQCCMCEQPVECGVHLVTKMIRGPYQGRYPHMKCAAAWYEQNPKPPPITVSQSSNELKFMMPKPEIVEFLDKFVRGEKHKFAIKGTAGSGKSNALVLAVRECCKAKLSILVLVFSVKAKEVSLMKAATKVATTQTS